MCWNCQGRWVSGFWVSFFPGGSHFRDGGSEERSSEGAGFGELFVVEEEVIAVVTGFPLSGGTKTQAQAFEDHFHGFVEQYGEGFLPFVVIQSDDDAWDMAGFWLEVKLTAVTVADTELDALESARERSERHFEWPLL